MPSYAGKTAVGAIWKSFAIGGLLLIGVVLGASSVLLPQGVTIGIVCAPVALLLWVAPDVRIGSGRMLLRMFYVFLASTIAIPNYAAIILPNIPWISARRIILNVFVGLLSLSLALSSKLRAYTMGVLKAAPILLFFTAGYLIFQLLLVFISDGPATSLTWMLNIVPFWWLPLFGAVALLRTFTHIENVLVCVTACMFFDMILAMIETALGHPFLIYALPASMRQQMITTFPMYSAFLVGSSRNGMYRAFSVFNNGLSYGEFSMMSLPLTAYFLVHGQTAKARAIGFAAVVGAFLSIVMSGSRGAYVGAIAAMIVFAMLTAVRHLRVRPGSLAGGITMVLYFMGSVAAVLAVFFVSFVRRLVLGGGEVQSSNDVRSLEWTAAMPKIWASPLWGHGPGTAAGVVGYVNFSGEYVLDSYLINVLVDTGMIGMVLFAGMLLLPIGMSLKRYVLDETELGAVSGAIGCTLIAYCIYRTTLSQSENNPLAYILVGVVFVIQYLAKRSQKAEGSARGMVSS